MNRYFPRLFEPIMIGRLSFKNRIVQAPCQTCFASINGEVTSTLIGFYSNQAKGGAALIEIGSCLIKYPQGRNSYYSIRIDDDRYIKGLHELVDVIHENGALASAQLYHAGKFAWKIDEAVAASDIPVVGIDGKMTSPKELGTEELGEIITFFAHAASRAKKAGFDMVSLDAAGGFLISDFLSPLGNRRSDRYGGNLENRMRFPLEIIAEIQSLCGKDFPIGFRTVADELLEGGIEIEEVKILAKELERAGIVFISLLVGSFESFHLGEGCFALRSPSNLVNPYAKILKKILKIPIFTNLNIRTPQEMEKIISEGIADVVALARPLISDPFLPQKAREGRLDDIRQCVGDSICIEHTHRNWALKCFQNPDRGRDKEFAIVASPQKKKVLVVGGGPAGLEASRVAALRGYKVILWEKDKKWGGNLRICSLLKGKERYRTFTIEWLVRQCQRQGVSMELNREGTEEAILKLHPDILILATGSIPYIPPIPGIDSNIVFLATDTISGLKTPKGKRVVVERGSFVGSEVALHLAENGFKVTLIEKYPEIAWKMDFLNRAYLIQKLSKFGVTVLGNSSIEEIKEKEVIVINNKDQEKRPIKTDSVIIAWGGNPNNSLAEKLNGKVNQLFQVGDCRRIGQALEAIHGASYIARQI